MNSERDVEKHPDGETRHHGQAGVIFDVDGTLLDTTYLHAVAWARAMRRHGHDVTMAELHRAVGIASEELVEHVLGKPDEATATAHSEEYEPFRDEVRPLPGAADLLLECHRRGLRVVIATSGKESDLEWMLPAIGVGRETLDGVVTASDVEGSKPAPDPFTSALEQNGLDPERTVVVGDTVWDIEAAARAGVRCIAVTCGGIDEPTLREAGAVEVHHHPAALLDALDDSALGRLS